MGPRLVWLNAPPKFWNTKRIHECFYVKTYVLQEQCIAVKRQFLPKSVVLVPIILVKQKTIVRILDVIGQWRECADKQVQTFKGGQNSLYSTAGGEGTGDQNR